MLIVPPMEDLENAWAELHEAVPRGWQIGGPAFDERKGEWSLYAWDVTERVKAGRRTRDWIAVHPTQSGVLREMARCLRTLDEGQVPK